MVSPKSALRLEHAVFPEEEPLRSEMSFLELLKAVVTDIHFLIPVMVLLMGIGLLIKLH